jgi:hypothetical protein
MAVATTAAVAVSSGDEVDVTDSRDRRPPSLSGPVWADEAGLHLAQLTP